MGADVVLLNHKLRGAVRPCAGEPCQQRKAEQENHCLRSCARRAACVRTRFAEVQCGVLHSKVRAFQQKAATQLILQIPRRGGRLIHHNKTYTAKAVSVNLPFLSQGCFIRPSGMPLSLPDSGRWRRRRGRWLRPNLDPPGPCEVHGSFCSGPRRHPAGIPSEQPDCLV